MPHIYIYTAHIAVYIYSKYIYGKSEQHTGVNTLEPKQLAKRLIAVAQRTMGKGK